MSTLNVDVLHAWAEAAPLRAEVGFAARSTQIDGELLKRMPDATREPPANVHGWQREQVLLACRSAWNWGLDSTPSPLGQYLGAVAARYVELREGKPSLRSTAHSCSWRALSLFMPQDLLLAAHAAQLDEVPSCDRVDCVAPSLRGLIDEGLAETHLHLGAALTFTDLWLGVLDDLAGPKPALEALAQAADQRYVTRLLAAAIVRVLLGAYLRHVNGAKQASGFEPFVEQRLPAIDRRLRCESSMTSIAGCCRAALAIVCVGADLRDWVGMTHVRMARALAVLSDRGAEPPATSLAELRKRDPLERWFSNDRGGAASETRFMARAIRHVRDTQDQAFAVCFWQYVRIRCQVFARLVETPGNPGLGWFVEHYDRIWAHRSGCDAMLVESALAVSGGASLRSLECRTTPAADWEGIRDSVRRVARAGLELTANQGGPELGLVFHCIKAAELGTRPSSSPAGAYYHGRYASWYADAYARAEAIVRALDQHPELGWVLRGFDTAAEEQAIPTWPLVGIYRRLREAGAELAGKHGHVGLLGLRGTLHVGEDFSRLVEGLRRVHEAIEFELLQPGDRMGHALALAWDARAWARDYANMNQTREERLDDLLWEHRWYQRGLSCVPSRAKVIAEEIVALGSTIHGRELAVETLARARELRHQPALLRTRFGYPHARAAHLDPATALGCVERYLIDRSTHVRGTESIPVAVSDEEVDFITRAQSRMMAEIAERGITIETNPSSNLVIGNFGRLVAHPTFRLRPTGTSRAGSPRVSINSDDPITFASSLVDEFALVHGALVEQQCGEAEALAWIDEARRAGLESRFTLPQSTSMSTLEHVCGGWWARAGR
jgi:hypothetical protein